MKLGITNFDPGFAQNMLSKLGSELPRNQGEEKNMTSYEILGVSKIKTTTNE